MPSIRPASSRVQVRADEVTQCIFGPIDESATDTELPHCNIVIFYSSVKWVVLAPRNWTRKKTVSPMSLVTLAVSHQ